MKYGTQTRLKYLLPYNNLHKIDGTELSKKAQLRLNWLTYYHQHKNAALTARHFGIQESVLWYWIKRFDPYSLSSLEDKSKRPVNVRKTLITDSIKDRIISLRVKYPGWGKKKIQKLLSKEGINVGRSRIQMVINEAKLKRIPSAKKKARRRNRKHIYNVPKQFLRVPGGIVYMDVKHLILTGGFKVYQFTAIDHATRKLFVRLFSRINSLSGKIFLEEIRKELKISYLGTDNGSEFLGECDRFCEKEGIQHVFSSPHSPKQNPFVERVIKTIIEEFYYFNGTEFNCTLQQEALNRYVNIYNSVRPHESLDLMTPDEKLDILSSQIISS